MKGIGDSAEVIGQDDLNTARTMMLEREIYAFATCGPFSGALPEAAVFSGRQQTFVAI